MTYSILAHDPDASELGVAVQSHYFGVGRVVPWARAGVGVVATQSIVEVSYGPLGLSRMAGGETSREALDTLLDRDAGAARRQVAFMDNAGRTAVHTGRDCIPAAGHRTAAWGSAHANLVESDECWSAMAESFEAASGDLARRMLAALRAAEATGGDIRGRQSAAMLVVRAETTGVDEIPLVDLRVDDSTEPLDELARLIEHSSAMDGLVQLLESPGLLSGSFTAQPDEVAHWVGELERAQAILAPHNREPTVWLGLLFARAGDDDRAAAAFASAFDADQRVGELVRRLASAGMWDRPVADLESILTMAANLNAA